jgi:UDP-N-acetylglucosamine:LPS N-acetylglucosamine transferase
MLSRRVLIFTASVGEGHDLPARTLADQIQVEEPGAEVAIVDGPAAMGRVIVALGEEAPAVFFYRAQWFWDVGFWFVAGSPLTRSFAKWLLARFGSRGLERVVREFDPDVVVSTWPGSTEVLGSLRRRGRLGVPAVAAVTDIAALHYWAARGIDVHLVTQPEAIAEVEQIAGNGTKTVCVHGLTAPEFIRPRAQAEARLALGLPADRKLVLVSGGGWGVGDLEGAVATALSLPDVQVIALCGRNDALAAQLQRAFRSEPRVRVEGFTDRMSDWLAAADALVHSTGGLTVLEAHIRGCPTISYGWGRGHLRAQNEAFRRFGFAEVVTTRAQLAVALAGALAARNPQQLSFAELPSAASVVLTQANARG